MSYLPWPTPPHPWQTWSTVDDLVAERSAGRLHVTITDAGTLRLRRTGGRPLGPSTPYVELTVGGLHLNDNAPATPASLDVVAERVDAAVARYLD